MKTIGFVGGSVPAGVGYVEGKSSSLIYPNVVGQQQGYRVVNLGRAGANNLEIFLASSRLILEAECDIVVVEWNSFYRFRFHMSPETELYIGPRKISPPDHYSHCEKLSKSDLNNFQRLLVLTNHEYQSILDLLEYCWILESQARLNHVVLVMLDGNTPWTQDLFTEPGSDLKSSLGSFAREILDFDNRSDQEILELLKQLRVKFHTLTPGIWVNIFNQFNNFTTDIAPTDPRHPGPQTHKQIAAMIINNLTERELL